MRHNRQRIELTRIVVVISFGFDVVAFGDNKHGKLGNLQHHVLLVILIEAHVTLLVERPLIFNVLDDVLVLNAPITVDIELFFNVFFIIIDFDDAFNFEHTN
jgi:hypothetical protein